MQHQINSLNQLRRVLIEHGRPVVVERAGRRAKIREQHAPFVFVSELAATGAAPVVNVTSNAVVMQVSQRSRVAAV